jgi:hypothetical protein
MVTRQWRLLRSGSVGLPVAVGGMPVSYRTKAPTHANSPFGEIPL